MPKFSVITPIHLWNTSRVRSFLNTIESVRGQTFKDFEWIIVDDGSTVDFIWALALGAHSNVSIIKKTHEERVIAYNQAFKVAKGEWFVLLDSDDEMTPDALAEMDQVIRENEKFKMFNFGCLYHHLDGGKSSRDPFEPKMLKVGHESFGGGNIVNGTFIWHREVYEKLGGYGPRDTDGHIIGIDTSSINYGGVRDLFIGSPYDFAAWFLLEFPEQQEHFFVNHEAEPDKIIKEIGNPWGQDHALFYKYTRKYHSKPVKKYLYIVHPR